MKKIFLLTLLYTLSFIIVAQDDVYPSPAQQQSIAITNATIHIGNGQVLNNATIVFNKGIITYVGSGNTIPTSAVIINGKGMQVYPGLILSNTLLGLQEVLNSARPTDDFQELGELNPNIHSIVAYNTDSKIINTLRTNGILLAQVVPFGELIAGHSSVVQLDAWHWEDAAYKIDNGMHVYFPLLINKPNPFAAVLGLPLSTEDPLKKGLEKIERIQHFFRAAKAYNNGNNTFSQNLKYEALKPLFQKKEKLFIHADGVKEMLIAINFAKEFDVEVVIVGASDSHLIANLLKQNNIAIVLQRLHSLPTLADDNIDQPFTTPAQLQKAGVLFAINDDDDKTRGRNLPFNAGTAACYGLTKEEALTAITLNAAKILGIDQKTGSLEIGKEANIVLVEGDILDMKTSLVKQCYIQGRAINMTNKHTQLYERYRHKYELK
jgi:imidazolonepropionase-like amidohydrolase